MHSTFFCFRPYFCSPQLRIFVFSALFPANTTYISCRKLTLCVYCDIIDIIYNEEIGDYIPTAKKEDLMTVAERQLLLCLSAYANGRERAEAQSDFSSEDCEALYALSSMHKLTAVVYDKMASDPDFCAGSPELLAAFRRDAIMQSALQHERTSALVSLTRELDREGIRYAVVKGAVCRELYHDPDLRHSADEDIYISPVDKTRADELFSCLGYALEGDGDKNVTHRIEPNSLLHIELHTRLLSESRTDDALEERFRSRLASVIRYRVGDAEINTFDPTYNLIYMVNHAKKHFISGGFGIRTLADIALFASRFDADIDSDELSARLREMNAETFFLSLLRIAREQLGITSALEKPLEIDDCGDLLSDIIEAGVYGQSTMSRRHSATLTLAETESGTRLGLLKTLFPPAETVKSRYPFAKKHPILLPVAWAKRLIDYSVSVIGSKSKENSPAESVAIHKKRLILLKKYGITSVSHK